MKATLLRQEPYRFPVIALAVYILSYSLPAAWLGFYGIELARRNNPQMQPMLCYLWQRIEVATPPSENRASTLQQVEYLQACEDS